MTVVTGRLASSVDNAMRAAARQLLTQKITQSPHLQVAVSSSEIKGHGDHESVVKVRLLNRQDLTPLQPLAEGGYRAAVCFISIAERRFQSAPTTFRLGAFGMKSCKVTTAS